MDTEPDGTPPGEGGTPPPEPQPPAPPGYAAPQPGWGEATGGYGGPPPPRTNGLAIAALVTSILGLCCFVGSVLGIVFGFVARSQIEQSGGTQTGREMALAGIIIGVIGLALTLLWTLLWLVIGSAPFFMGF